MSNKSPAESMDTSNKFKVLAIYQTNDEGIEIFTSQYAQTKFEALKYCVHIIKEEYKKLTGKEEYERILWFGETPPSEGIYPIYGLPGPNVSKIDIVQFITTKGWFGSCNSTKRLFSIHYKPIFRVRFPTTIPSPSEHTPIEEVVEGESTTEDDGTISFAIKNFDKSKLKSATIKQKR